MEKIENIEIFENEIEQAFILYFENRGIDILTEFQKVPNSIYSSAFDTIYRKVLKPKGYIFRKPDIDVLPVLDELTGYFIRLCNEYNITAFIHTYCYYIGIDENIYYKWLYGNSNSIGSDELTAELQRIAQKVGRMPAESIRNKLSNDRIGQVTLANQDRQVGLEYAKQSIENRIEIAKKYQLTDISGLLDNKKD